jgi:hypothetical protein
MILRSAGFAVAPACSVGLRVLIRAVRCSAVAERLAAMVLNAGQMVVTLATRRRSDVAEWIVKD